MKNEEYQELKDLYVKHMQEYMCEAGGLFPNLTVFADQKQKEEEDAPKAIIHVPIPGEYMNSEESKNSFIDDIIPSIFKKINEKFIPYGVAWASEAWMRVVDKKDAIKIADGTWKDIVIKKEVLILSIETENITETILYEIKRTGQQVNPEGELVDTIKLEQLEDMKPDKVTGRFTGLYKKLKS